MVHRTTVATLVLALLSLASCGDNLPLEGPTPTPTPTPAQRLEAAAARMATLTSLAFRLSHEEGTTQVFESVEATAVSGEVAIPGGANVEVEAEALGFFVSINIVVSGDQAYMTDPISRSWQTLPASDLPFDFRDLGATLAGIVRSVDSPAFGAGLEIDGVSTQGITGTVSGSDLTTLIPGAAVDAMLDIELWMDGDGLVRRVRLSDPIVEGDVANVVRVLDFSAFDEPVSVTVPE